MRVYGRVCVLKLGGAIAGTRRASQADGRVDGRTGFTMVNIGLHHGEYRAIYVYIAIYNILSTL